MLIGSNVMTIETDGTSCVRGDTICPRPLYAGTRRPIPYVCGAQRALLPIAVGATDINE